MSNSLDQLGRWVARRHRIVIMAWIAGVLLFVGLGRMLGGTPVDDFRVPGVESQKAVDLLSERFPERAGATATVVFHTSNGPVTGPEASHVIADTIAKVRSLPRVTSVTDPRSTPGAVSRDGTTAIAAVRFDAPAADLGRSTLDGLRATAPRDRIGNVQIEFGGELPTVFKEQSEGFGEIIGVVAALLILFLTFRALAAMVLPLGLAVVALAAGLSIVALVAAMIAIPSIAPRLGTMIGLGVGIDYALFVVSRHREQLSSGMDVHESIGRANATAGQAVVVAGGTVVVAILGLQFAGIPFVAALGYSASIVVAVAVTAAVTLLPALLSVLGLRILPRSERDVRRAPPHQAGGWIRWAHWVAFHPWRSAIAATVVLVVFALPMLTMRLGQADAGSDPIASTQRRAYDLVAAGFGAGHNGPLIISVDLGSRHSVKVLDRLHLMIASDPDVQVVTPPELNTARDTGVITVLPKSKPQAEETSALVHRLRDDVVPAATAGTGATALVGGPTAGFIDQSDRIAARLPWFIAGVVLVAFVLFVLVFRSILVPLKAAVLNLLSIGAAYGVVVAVFQWGWGRSLLGLSAEVPIASFVPMMMFAILFGLSMDYEVFILSRIREEYHNGRSNIDSVVVGLGATARVITAAALIMVSVFGAFVASEDPVVKMMGVGLATAVAVDATIVRMVLVPATMALVGDPNWWFPRWLDRVLPRIDIEGGQVPRPAVHAGKAPASSNDEHPGPVHPGATATEDNR